jgi:hypothetical protein
VPQSPPLELPLAMIASGVDMDSVRGARAVRTGSLADTDAAGPAAAAALAGGAAGDAGADGALAAEAGTIIGDAVRGMVEQRAWKSSLALFNWAALARSAVFILYFLAAAFSIFAGTPSRRRPSMVAASWLQTGSTFGASGTEAVVIPNSPMLLQPAANTDTMTTAAAVPIFLIMIRFPQER